MNRNERFQAEVVTPGFPLPIIRLPSEKDTAVFESLWGSETDATPDTLPTNWLACRTHTGYAIICVETGACWTSHELPEYAHLTTRAGLLNAARNAAINHDCRPRTAFYTWMLGFYFSSKTFRKRWEGLGGWSIDLD
jgi:hypothetical protein